MATQQTFGEYVRQLRRRKRLTLQDVSDSAGLSVAHLSRLENDNGVPNAGTVVKLSNALEGDLEFMLDLCKCLPEEILDRLSRRATDAPTALRRSAGSRPMDETFPQALIDDMDPTIRGALAEYAGIGHEDIDGLFELLRRFRTMDPAQRSALFALFARVTEGT
jgi:transcriptional regulator with XRE-family HTH domain